MPQRRFPARLEPFEQANHVSAGDRQETGLGDQSGPTGEGAAGQVRSCRQEPERIPEFHEPQQKSNNAQ